MLSPQKAADKAGVSRATITNAIKSERLRARRGNEGRWLISPEALEAWMTDRPTVSKSDTDDVKPLTDGDVRLLTEVAVLRSQNEELRSQLLKVETKSEEEITRLREQLTKVETKAEAEKEELKKQLMEEKADRRTLQDRLNEAPRRRSLREIIFAK